MKRSEEEEEERTEQIALLRIIEDVECFKGMDQTRREESVPLVVEKIRTVMQSIKETERERMNASVGSSPVAVALRIIKEGIDQVSDSINRPTEEPLAIDLYVLISNLRGVHVILENMQIQQGQDQKDAAGFAEESTRSAGEEDRERKPEEVRIKNRITILEEIIKSQGVEIRRFVGIRTQADGEVVLRLKQEREYWRGAALANPKNLLVSGRTESVSILQKEFDRLFPNVRADSRQRYFTSVSTPMGATSSRFPGRFVNKSNGPREDGEKCSDCSDEKGDDEEMQKKLQGFADTILAETLVETLVGMKKEDRDRIQKRVSEILELNKDGGDTIESEVDGQEASIASASGIPESEVNSSGDQSNHAAAADQKAHQNYGGKR